MTALSEKVKAALARAAAVHEVARERGSAICSNCGGSILPPAIAGIERGSCHCLRPGRLTAKMFFSNENQQGSWRVYGVEWDGIEIAVVPPTLTRAVEVLNQLRDDAAAMLGDSNK